MRGGDTVQWRKLSWLISLSSILYVGWQVYQAPADWHTISGHGLFAGIAAAAVLAILQLLVETHKWRRLLRIQGISVPFPKAFTAVLAGFAAGAITPNRIGEYAGRMLVLGEERGSTIISQTVLDRLTQSFPTWLAGIWLGWELLGTAQLRVGIFAGVLLASLAVLTGAWYLGDELPWILQLKKFLKQVWKELLASSPHAWLGSIAWSCVRYGIFVGQFVLLAHAVGIPAGSAQLAAFIATVFWIKSLMPFIGFSELGVRESIALSLATQHGWPATPVVAATFILYGLNNLLPTAAGAWIVRNPNQGWKP